MPLPRLAGNSLEEAQRLQQPGNGDLETCSGNRTGNQSFSGNILCFWCPIAAFLATAVQFGIYKGRCFVQDEFATGQHAG